MIERIAHGSMKLQDENKHPTLWYSEFSLQRNREANLSVTLMLAGGEFGSRPSPRYQKAYFVFDTVKILPVI
jgi:hypothetical protein